MKRIKGMNCTAQADIMVAQRTGWQFLMEMFAKKKNKNEKKKNSR